MGVIPREYDYASLTTDELAALTESHRVAALLPVGSVEPHGPHLPLLTDTLISESACVRAAGTLSEAGIHALIAPPVPYGVTECASGFPGAVSVSPEVLTQFIVDVARGLMASGAVHVCLVNNHLEPEHDGAVRAAAAAFETGQVSVASPLTRRWGRTLTDEFKSGACHAGQYETSIVLAEDKTHVRAIASELPEVPVSLSEKLAKGITDFREMGLERSYAGAPAAGSRSEGDRSLDLLAAMIHAEVIEALRT